MSQFKSAREPLVLNVAKLRKTSIRELVEISASWKTVSHSAPSVDSQGHEFHQVQTRHTKLVRQVSI